MAGSQVAERLASHNSAEAHAARMAAAGCASHLHAQDLAGPLDATTIRDLDDLVHLLGHLYAGSPSPVALALLQCPAGPMRSWLVKASDSFERERQYLVRLTSAVGPVPSTPGHAETEAAMLAQRHALETLARSERRGCALGAATALVSDWRDLRPLLDRAAQRVHVPVPPCDLPDERSVADVLSAVGDDAISDRAIRFGSEQMLLQHRSLFDLLEARSEAREDY